LFFDLPEWTLVPTSQAFMNMKIMSHLQHLKIEILQEYS